MTRPMTRWTVCLFPIACSIALLACSASKKANHGGAGQGAGTGAAANGGGGNLGAGQHDSGVGTGNGDAGGKGNGDAAAHKDAATDAGKDGSTANTHDAGHDAGRPPLLGCRAPTPATRSGNTCPSGSAVTLKATKIGTSFDNPVFVTHSPNDPAGRLFVVERTGKIQVVKNGTTNATPFLDVSVTTSFDEQGLLGLAFDPDYENTARFWVYYTSPDNGTGTKSMIESYVATVGNPDVADATSKTPLAALEDPESNHNGGMLAFGPDGCLYAASGDGGGSNDAHTNHSADGNAQSLDTELGKLLRFDTAHPSMAAPGNKTGGSSPYIWDYGLRNPWRFSFDAKSGDIYIGDVGQDVWEEIDVEPSGHGQNNYGWKFMEGTHCRGDAPGTAAPTTCSSHAVTGYVAPIYDYSHTNNNNCVIGGYVYRGKNIPSLDGYYLFADYGGKHVWALVWDGTKACKAPIDLSSQLTMTGNVTSFGEDVDGELYITTVPGGTGTGYVYRVDAM